MNMTGFFFIQGAIGEIEWGKIKGKDILMSLNLPFL